MSNFPSILRSSPRQSPAGEGPPYRLGKRRWLHLVLFLVIAGCSRAKQETALAPVALLEPEVSGPAYFADVTADSGVNFVHRNGENAGHFSILDTLGGGVALLDYDGDGLLDIFVTGGGFFDGPDQKRIRGYSPRLYKNLGNSRFIDVTEKAGLNQLAGGQEFFYSHGAAVSDYDRDGWPDLLVTGYGRVALFHNESDGQGGRRFHDVTRESGLLGTEHFWSTSAAWGDLDGDGWPDLYLCQYVDWSFANNHRCKGYSPQEDRDACPPARFAARPHALFHNVVGENGARRFVDDSQAAGIRMPPREDRDYGKGLGVLLVDVDGDGKPDIYVANDTTDNFLYLNQSVPGKLSLKESGFALGVARDDRGTPNGSMGLDASAYDESGWPSLWVTNYEGELHALYRNLKGNGELVFLFSTQASGIATIGQNFVGFGTGFLDLDNDGWEDLVISHGHISLHPQHAGLRQLPVLLRNQGNGRFLDQTKQGGAYFQTKHRGRGLAIGDLDNDGRADLVLCHLNEPVTILRNVADPRNHWLGIELSGRDHADTVGARLTLHAGTRQLRRFAKGGGSYLSSNDRRHLFGLGTASKVERLTVEWPSGEPRVQHWDGLAIDRYWRLTQGQLEASAPGK